MKNMLIHFKILSSLLLTGSLILLFSSCVDRNSPTVDVYESPLAPSRENLSSLWSDVESQLFNHPKVIYYDRNLRNATTFNVGLVNSNEFGHASFTDLDREGADLHVGFGTTVNFSILGYRRGRMENGLEQTRSAIFADLSKEVVAMMMSFWRPIWLISETPEEWFSHVALLQSDPSTSVQELMAQIEGETWNPQSAVFDRIQNLLNALVLQNRISQVDKRFTLSVLRDQLLPPVQFSGIDLAGRGRMDRVGTLGNSIGGLYMARWICAVFDPLRIQNPFGMNNGFSRMPSHYAEQVRLVSFLLNADHYQRVRRLFLEDKDFYALAEYSDPEFWFNVAENARQRRRQLTDVYLVNILEFLGQNIATYDFRALFMNHNMPGDRITIYNTGLSAPRMMHTRSVEIH